jgi:hypothetical protein
MAKYDDASWHYGGDFPADLDPKFGATHIGMFLTWCIDNKLNSQFHVDESRDDLEKVKARLMTGAEFLINNCDEKFTDEDLNEIGNEFASAYYQDDTDFVRKHSGYLQDFEFTMKDVYNDRNIELESSYHVEDSWENYQTVKELIDRRFQEWKTFAKK